MAKKILYCASVDYHFKAFHLPYMKWFQDQGWEVHVAAKGNINLPYCDIKYDVHIERSPFKKENIKAYKQLKKLIIENNYDIIHVHTPLAGVLVRLAARTARKNGTKVIYTAHGFHFCKGAPLLNWIIYYPIERWLSRYTDSLITINEEDYELAVRHKFRANNINLIHGVGFDSERFKVPTKREKSILRKKHGYKNEDFILYYVAELNKNKNQILLLKAIAKLKSNIPNIKLLLVGSGLLTDHYKSIAEKLEVSNNIEFLGFRKDVDEIVKLSDIAVASSLREGLPVNIMEAMASGKPIVATDNRGHRALIKNNINGFLVDCLDENILSKKVLELFYSQKLRKYLSFNSINDAKKYYLINVKKEMVEIYNSLINQSVYAYEVNNKNITFSNN